MEILFLMLLLQVKHWYADFGIQTYDQTVKKGVYGDIIGISHSCDHVIGSMLALLIFSVFHTINPLIIVCVSIAEGVAHYHIDWCKVKYGTKNMSTSKFWQEFGLDQLAHQVTYLAMIYYLLII